MVRAPCFDLHGMKKGAWSKEEDNKLRAFVQIYGHWNWRLVPKYAGLARCGKSCRLRWVNYLQPGVRRGNFSKQEEDLIIKLHAHLGNKWAVIATNLPGRTDNDIKNFYHTRIEKRRRQNPAAKNVVVHTSEASSKHDQVMKEERPFEVPYCQKARDESASSEASSLNKLQQSELSFDTNTAPLPITQQFQVDLWPDRLLAGTKYNQSEYFPPLLEDEFFNPDLHYSKLSRSSENYSSYQLRRLDWIADDDHPTNISSEYVGQLPPQEAGGLYDALIQYFDYGMNRIS